MFEKEIEQAIKTLFDVSRLLSRLQRWANEYSAPVSPEIETLLSEEQKKSPVRQRANRCFTI